MVSRIVFWLKCSRVYSLPMTFFSWLIVFCYGLKHNGNVFYGVLALLGVSLCHLATNLFDDYMDFKSLKKTFLDKVISLPNTQRGKCAYLLNHSTTLKKVLRTVFVYLLLASLIGLYFIITRGLLTILFMLMGGVIVLGYSFFSNHRLSEIAVGLAFGPVLFGGVYFVMTGQVCLDSFLISLPSMMFTINLLYTDTLLDYDIDKKEGKKTLTGVFGKLTALEFQKTIIILAYFFVSILGYYEVLSLRSYLVVLTVPLALDLVKSCYLYFKTPDMLPERKWYHFPFEDWDDIEKNRSASFMFRMYQARNLMIYSSIIISLSIL